MRRAAAIVGARVRARHGLAASGTVPPFVMSTSTASATARPAADAAPTGDIVVRWLVRVRWAMLVLLGATLPISDRVLGQHVRYELAIPALVLPAVLNVALARRLRAASTGDARALVAPVLALDLVGMGIVLASSGGAGNPFSALFFVHVALAAALLPARSTFLLAGLAAAVFAALFALPTGACCPSHPAHGAFSAHLWGMLLAFVLSAGVVAFFLHGVRRALEERAAEAAALRRQADEAARFQALGTLAAGTAHELGTPLGTIAVLAGEQANDAAADEGARRRAAAIADQVERCRHVLAKMRASLRAPELRGGVDLAAAVDRGVEAWRRAHPGVEVVVRASERSQRVPLDASDIEAALCTLLDNALQATMRTGRTAPIAVSVVREGGAAVVRVDDEGEGIAEAVEGRLGEPFVTTKGPGEGMGLGLYLVRTLIEPIGGKLEIAPREPRGTRVALRLMTAEG